MMRTRMDRRFLVFRKRGISLPWILLLASLLMTACSPGNSAMGGSGLQPSGESIVEAQATAPPSPSPSPSWPVHLERSSIAKQPPRYIPLVEAGGYDKSIVPDTLLQAESRLPEATVSAIPYWTGFVMENKGCVNFSDGRWDTWTDGSSFFYEENIKEIAAEGFNCCRVMYSLSNLSDPSDPLRVDKTQLQCLDELVSWGFRYNVHIMISIMGLPGKNIGQDEAGKRRWPNEALQQENVQSNDELFRNPEMAALYQSYMEMLVSRYKGIPNRNLSVELLAEPAVPDFEVSLYEDVLLPVVASLQAIDDTRILIANDVAKKIPERLAQAGCALSLHNHVYAVDGRRLKENLGIDYQGKWPMEYLPGRFGGEEDAPLVLFCEEGFSAGTLEVYFEYGNIRIAADGKTLLTSVKHETWSSGDPDSGGERVQIPAGTREISVGAIEWADALVAVRLLQEDRDPVTLATHLMYQEGLETDVMPRIRVFPDGTTSNADDPQRLLDAAYMKERFLQPWIDCANRNGVGFLLTEVGTDTHDLTREGYEAYEGAWLSALKEERIPWMYNCLHGVLAPQGSVQTDVAYSCGFRDVEQVPDTPFEKVAGLFDWLKHYQ